MRFTARFAKFLAVLSTVTLVHAGGVSAADWATQGGNDHRTQASAETMGHFAAVEAWTNDAGTTGVQPLFVGEWIYHLAGDKLLAYGPDGAKVELGRGFGQVKDGDHWIVRPSTSGLSFQVVNGTRLLYFGTGSNKVCAYRLDQKNYVCKSLTPASTSEAPIVTAPLVFKVHQDNREVDLVVMGDKRGRVWVVQNLASATVEAEVSSVNIQDAGWILASPVPIGGDEPLGFVWASDNGGDSKIAGERIVPADGTQPLRIERIWVNYPPTGIADGFAKYGNKIYAADKLGNFHAYDAASGISTTEPYGPSRSPMFANAAPAVDDDRVYFAIRNVGTTSPSLTDYPGRLVALNRHTFTLEWEANLDAPANTNPLVWTQGPNVVLVGDTNGTIYAFDRKTGAPSPFALDAQCQPMSKLSLGAPSRAGENYQTLTGVSEPILASGSAGQALLIMGVSGSEGGSLKAFRAGGGYNAAWTNPTIPENSLSVGQPFTHTTNLTLTSWNGAPLTDRTLGLAAYWVPTAEARSAGAQARALPGAVPAEVTMAPGATMPVTITFTPIAEDGAEGQLVVIVNPRQAAVTDTNVGRQLREAISLSNGQIGTTSDSAYRAGNWSSILGHLPGHCDGAAGEISPDGIAAAMADNLLAGAMTIGQMVDLSVRWSTVPPAVACAYDQSQQVSFAIINPSGQTLKGVPFEAYVTDGLGRYPLKQGRTDLAPGANTVTGTFYTRSCGAESTLHALVNLGPEPRPVKEPTFDNNRATAAVQVAESGPRHTPTESDSMVIIVPADCQPNPDPSSSYPCTNYPNLRRP